MEGKRLVLVFAALCMLAAAYARPQEEAPKDAAVQAKDEKLVRVKKQTASTYPYDQQGYNLYSSGSRYNPSASGYNSPYSSGGYGQQGYNQGYNSQYSSQYPSGRSYSPTGSAGYGSYPGSSGYNQGYGSQYGQYNQGYSSQYPSGSGAYNTNPYARAPYGGSSSQYSQGGYGSQYNNPYSSSNYGSNPYGSSSSYPGTSGSGYNSGYNSGYSNPY